MHVRVKRFEIMTDAFILVELSQDVRIKSDHLSDEDARLPIIVSPLMRCACACSEIYSILTSYT